MKETKMMKVRRAVADYMQAEGCSCCRDNEQHDKVKEELAKLIHVAKYKDGSGYNFNKYCTNPLIYEGVEL